MQNNHSMDFKWFMANGLPYHEIEKQLIDFFNKGYDLLSIAKHDYFKQFKTKSFVANFYTSGKILIQGSFPEDLPLQIATILFDNISNNISYTYFIGLDEAGKGERQGALVVGALFCRKQDIPKLIALGVTDSKTLQTKKLQTISQNLQDEFIVSTRTLAPDKFNLEWKKFGNLNILLEYEHINNLKQLLNKVQSSISNFPFENLQVVIDKFASNESRTLSVATRQCGELKKANIILENKAEYYPFVAGASIVAKAMYDSTKNTFKDTKDWKTSNRNRNRK